MTDKAITHYEEYVNGVFKREVTPHEFAELTDDDFQTKRYFPVRWGESLFITKLPNSRLKVQYKIINWKTCPEYHNG